MASMAISSAAQLPSREWITPQEQLDRFHKYNARPIADEIPTSKIFSPEPDQITKLPNITSIIAEYAVEALSPDLTDWHTALGLRGALPEKIPALPWNMPQIMEGKCPIWGNELKPDGTPYKYRDKWSLCLITTETVNELEARVKAYGERALNDQGEKLYPNENPLQIRFFGAQAKQDHGDVRSSDELYWILHTNELLPGSPNKPYQELVEMVAKLYAKGYVNCEVPLLSETLTACFNRQITRGEQLYSKTSELNGKYTYTYVQEASRGYQVVVGGSHSYGLFVYWHDVNRGIAAVRRF